MSEELSLQETERRLKSDHWYFDPLIRQWVDRRDGRLAVALERVRERLRRVKALEEREWDELSREVAQQAALQGDPPGLVWERMMAERSARKLAEAEWYALTMPGLPRHMEAKRLPLTVTQTKAAASGESTFAGYLAVFGNRDAHDDIIAPGACDATLAALTADPYSERFLLPMLFAHDHAKPLGGFTTLEANQRGLAFTASINTETQLGRETASLVKSGGLRGMSIGYVAEKTHMAKGGVRVIERLRLIEGSVVALGSNPLAKVYQPPV